MKRVYSKNTNFLIMVAFYMLSSLTPLLAQQKVKVLTKTIHKEMDFNSQQLVINGEKSTINISGNEGKHIKIEMRLISKNIDGNKAREELNIIKYAIKETGDAVILSNYFESNEYQNITSNLSVEYDITVPYKCPVNLTNIYGNIVVNQLHSSLEVKSSFGEMKMANIRGKINLDLKYVNLYADNITAELQCIADKSDLHFNEVTGTGEFKTNYGEINVHSPSGNISIEIDATRTKVNLELPKYLNYSYQLATRSSEIFVPETLKGKYKTDKQLKTFSSQNTQGRNIIKVNTTYCPITITKY